MKLVKEKSIICIAYKWLGEKKTHIISIGDDVKRFQKDPFDDTYVIKEFQKVIEEADLAIAHNGDKFDMKFYNSRLLKHGLSPLMIKTYDTLKAAKYYFSLHSNRLGDIAKYLEVDKKSKSELSWWDDILFKSDRKALTSMEKYCIQDVNVLEQVYKKILPFVQGNHPTFGIKADGSKCPRCESQKTQKWGIYHAISNSYQKHKCKDCGHVFRESKAVKKDK